MQSSSVKKLIIVVGGTGDIGREVSKHLVSHYNIAITYHSNQSNMELLHEDLSLYENSSFKFYKNDATIKAQVFETYQKIKEDFQQAPYALIYCAGYSKGNLWVTAKPEEYQKNLDVNLFGAIHWVKAISSDLIRSKVGKIIALSSNSTLSNIVGLSAYNVSKAALEKFIFQIGSELIAFGITANIIRPGLLKTNMSNDFISQLTEAELCNALAPLKNYISVAEILLAINYFLESSQTNATAINIDGGHGKFKKL
jgi:3-oxoacyl-[acyl-carrier protein] reductase